MPENLASQSERNHSENCTECRAFEFEAKLIAEHRTWVETTVRQIIREELHAEKSNNERIYHIELWLGMVRVGRYRIYLLPLIVIGQAIIHLLKLIR